MAKIYIIYGQNREKEWPITSYIDVYSTKQHFNKLNEFIKFRDEFVGPLHPMEEFVNEYDPSGNMAESHYVITTSSFYTLAGFKAYNQIDEYKKGE